MKASEALLEAAQLIDDGTHNAACWAIGGAYQFNSWYLESLAMEYFSLFKQDFEPRSFWFGDFRKINQDRRVIALLLASAIAESEGN